jgi:hypothetical protein
MDQHMDVHKRFNDTGEFALDILDFKRDGYYVEMGSADPIKGNTTYKMETEYGWKGVGFDLDPEHAKNYNEIRKNPCLVEDATKFNYIKYFEENNFPKQIDYLQIDIEAPVDNSGRPVNSFGQPLLGLISLPLNQYRFSVIVFEHEYLNYFRNDVVRDAQRTILDSLGYSLATRIGHEDWWVDPKVVPYSKWKFYNKYESC